MSIQRIRSAEAAHIVTLLISQDIGDTIASENEIAELLQGDFVPVSTKAISAQLFKK